MAKKVREEDEEEEEVTTTRRAPQTPRLSFSVTPETRKKIRLAAALSDMDDGEWCRVVLVKYAKLVVEKNFPGMAS